MNKETKETKTIKCACGHEALFFHSKCCNSHFEGVILMDGQCVIVCEECGKYCGTVYQNPMLQSDFLW